MDTDGTGRPRWSVSQAAKRTGVARSTIQRYIAQGRMPGAYTLPDGTWSIGVEDLLAAGLRVDAPTPPDPPAEGVQHRPAQTAPGQGAEHDDRLAELETARQRLEMELADARRRAEVAEAIAQERAAQITDLRRTVAALEAGLSDRQPRQAPSPEPAPTAPPAATPRPRRLLGRVVDRLGL